MVDNDRLSLASDGLESMGTFMTTARHVDDRGEAAGTLAAPRRPRNARPSISGRGFAPSAAVLGSQVGSRAVDAPWWAFCLLTMLGLAAVCLQIVFPQDSVDKLAWWNDRWRTKQRSQCRAERPVTRSGKEMPSSCEPAPSRQWSPCPGPGILPHRRVRHRGDAAHCSEARKG